jgi:hypothetical protein
MDETDLFLTYQQAIFRGTAAWLAAPVLIFRVAAAWLAAPFLLLAACLIGCWWSLLGIKRPDDG